MQNKTLRHNKIKEILKDHHIGNQEELVKLLAGEGIEVTQATLSRDFQELGVIRTVISDGNKYTLNVEEAGNQIRKLISFEILSVEFNEMLILVRTLAGRAQGVAHYIDKLNSNIVLGTIAGDDTIMIVPSSINKIPEVVELVNKIMNEEKT
ncbi:MAG: arginine repressor [Bacteroidetes bacterium]|nr:arginine repressor [Bacteroidota bacterium]MBU1679122.1 arginine repressor [Bacteroidota bacterium]MBU2508265.1 arginine repressor [Bacteroidota bacterium]